MQSMPRTLSLPLKRKRMTKSWRREQARAAAAATIEKVDRNIKAAGNDVKSMGDAATEKWTALKTKIAGDLQSMKSGIAQKKHDFDARRAEKYADSLEWEASLAVDYAIAAVDQAELAVLDAVAGGHDFLRRECLLLTQSGHFDAGTKSSTAGLASSSRAKSFTYVQHHSLEGE